MNGKLLSIVPPSDAAPEDGPRAAIDSAIAILEEWRAEGIRDVDVVVIVACEYPVKIRGEERNRSRLRWSTNCHRLVAAGLIAEGSMAILDEDLNAD